MAEIIGRDRVLARFGKLRSVRTLDKINQAVVHAGALIADEAKGSIMRGSASGHSGGKHQHVPSKPGEPPKNDTQHLHDGIEVINVAPLKVEVRSTAAYSAYLEYGTSRMAARPYMRPALAKTKAKALGVINDALGRAARESGS